MVALLLSLHLPLLHTPQASAPPFEVKMGVVSSGVEAVDF